jgi:hypothetical protein
MQKHENNSSKDWTSPAENLKSSKIQALGTMGYNSFFKTFGNEENGCT